MKKTLRYGIICLTLVLNVVIATAQSGKVAPFLSHKVAQGGTASCLLIFPQADISTAKNLKGKVNKAEYVWQTLSANQAAQHNVIALLQQRNIKFKTYKVINAIQLEVDQTLLNELAQRQDIEKIIFDVPLHNLEPVNTGTGTRGGLAQWGIPAIQADSVWSLGYRGQGVTAAGNDTGIDWMHPSLHDNYRGWNGTTADHNYNWHDAIHGQSPLSADPNNPCGFNITAPCDDNSHGTHTVGTIAGLPDLTSGLAIGVAPEAKWMGCRNMERGNGQLSTYLECFDFFLAPTDTADLNPNPALAPDVINNSWYCSLSEGCDASNWDYLDTAVQVLRTSGVVVVISVGNEGNQCSSAVGPPGFFEKSFSIGASDEFSQLAGFSSRGPITIDGSMRMKPNVSAPGVNIMSSVPGGMYSAYSGTSMAGPHCAGVVALMISANPDLAGEVDLIEDIIEQTATHIPVLDSCGGATTEVTPNNMFGHGIINALAAVQYALSLVDNHTTAQETPAKIFPVPAKDILHVELYSDNASLILYDVTGRPVINKQNLQRGINSIEVGSLPAGIYFYKIKSETADFQGKVILSYK